MSNRSIVAVIALAIVAFLLTQTFYTVDPIDGSRPVKVVRSPVQFNHEPASLPRAPEPAIGRYRASGSEGRPRSVRILSAAAPRS